MVGIGIVGIGFMGMIHYLAARRLDAGRVAAICTRDPKKRAGDWTAIQGNFGPKGSHVDLSGVQTHADISTLLDDPAVDLVDLCVPNDEHAGLAIRAMEAGKHVLVEKPIALTLRDADAMVAASRSTGRLLMVAHVLPFSPEFAFAVDAVRGGRHGRLRAASFTRVISRPTWSSGIADSDRSGGPAIDLHIHDTHLIGLLCGNPRAVHSRGVVEGGAVVHLTSQYIFDDDGPAVSAVSGALSQPGRPFMHGFDVFLEDATLAFHSENLDGQTRVGTPLIVIKPDGTVERPAVGSSDPLDWFHAELTVAVEAVRSGVEAHALSGDLARQALALCLAEVESVRTGREVSIR